MAARLTIHGCVVTTGESCFRVTALASYDECWLAFEIRVPAPAQRHVFGPKKVVVQIRPLFRRCQVSEVNKTCKDHLGQYGL